MRQGLLGLVEIAGGGASATSTFGRRCLLHQELWRLFLYFFRNVRIPKIRFRWRIPTLIHHRRVVPAGGRMFVVRFTKGMARLPSLIPSLPCLLPLLLYYFRNVRIIHIPGIPWHIRVLRRIFARLRDER